MKSIVLTLLAVMINSLSFCQNIAYEHEKNNSKYVNSNTLTLFKFEAYSGSGIILFGVATSYERAQWIIKDFKYRNRKNKYKPVNSVIKQSVTTDMSYFRKYRVLFPKGYQLLYPHDLTIYRILKVEGKPQAITYTEQAKEFSYDQAIDYVNTLETEYPKYRIGF